MRNFAKISPKFWTGKTGKEIRSLGFQSQILALYLMTSPHSNMIGVYYLPISYICHDTGSPFEGASKGLASLSKLGFCTYDDCSEFVWVQEMAKHQCGGQLKENDKRVPSINNDYLSLPDLPFLSNFYDKYQYLFHLKQRRNNVESDCNNVDLVIGDEQLLQGASKGLARGIEDPSKQGDRDRDKRQRQETRDTRQETETEKKTFVEQVRPVVQKKSSSDVLTIFEHWKDFMKHPNAKLDDKRKKIISKALGFGYSVEELCDAITGCSFTPHNIGFNDRGQRYDGLHVILRDGDQIDRFTHNCYNPPRPLTKADELHYNNLAAGASWAADKKAEWAAEKTAELEKEKQNETN